MRKEDSLFWSFTCQFSLPEYHDYVILVLSDLPATYLPWRVIPHSFLYHRHHLFVLLVCETTMSKEEFLKIQTCVLKVNIHCDGCKQKVKKILQKIDGVYTTQIDSELGKVTVSGNVDPGTLIKKLAKSGKHAEIWGAPKPNNNNQQNQLNNQIRNMQIDSGKGSGGNNKGQAVQKGGGNNQQQQQQPKGGGQLPQGMNMMNPQQLQQLKALQDGMKLPQMKDLKMPAFNGKDQNQKAVKFNLPEDEDFSDDYDDDDDDDYEDDDLDDDIYDAPAEKMKPLMGVNNAQGMPKGGMGMMPQGMMPKGMMPQGMPNMMMNSILNGQPPQKGGNNGGGNNGKKGGGGGGGGGGNNGGGNIPVQVNMGGGNNGGGKKGGNGNNQGGGGGSAQKGGKNGGGQPQEGKNGGGQSQNKNGNGGGGGGAGGGGGGNGNINGNMPKKMNDGLQGMPNMMAMNAGTGNVGPMGSMPMGPMGNVPMGQMANLAAVQGLPAASMNNGVGGGSGAVGPAGGGGGGYFQGAGPEMMAGNPYYQQQMAAMMMNQQRANGNERFQPMMYARPPPAVNYMPPPYPTYPYHPYPPPGEHYHAFSDENTSSCTVM